ncbi:DNA methyltransferase 1-associated protein 1 [Sporothrix schenckii 1099-18]|uniref:SWR1-complex protein 4 n=2 Tax=Sporothrix schenckii TaxID=29908 RepID=U7Q543_SPOS1|nr:DNA methyltransferase 1-associated protein 1 [Sporothrix schenckii 1099-18]ERT01841.1 hypothetical protein HMPREF1624_00135 [Sporothrix schenckii ATCC 58251]KJR81024.1 DNA methyltransferase 1-associated protein 1 [Sporothrix schenckii 1099-18]
MATSLDARDVLNLPQDGSSGAGSRPTKKQRTGGHALGAGASRNLKGLAREVQSLGGESPISIVPQLSNIKKRRLANRKPAARWELRAFTNSARDDKSLVLRHWRRKVPAGSRGDARAAVQAGEAAGADAMETDDPKVQEGQPGEPEQPMDDSAFAKFNVRVVVPQYSDDQYAANLQHPDWTKEETDYLMELVKDFDLRWPLIWDRYDYRPADGAAASSPPASAADATAVVPASQPADGASRTMEDLKARYYEIAAKMMAVQKPAQYMTQAEYNLHGIMANFNPEKERQRKAFVTNALMRSREEVREEEALLFEVRRIMDRTERTNDERRDLYHRLEFPIADQDISSFKTSAGLQTLLQSLMYSNEKSKKRKSLAAGEAAGAAGAAGASGGAAGAAGADAGSRRDSIAASGAGGANRRESANPKDDKANATDAAATPTAAAASSAAAATATAPATPVAATPTASGKNNKKGQPQMERRKLTEQEQDVYGVTYHDRLGSGPTFRYEKINKLFTHKSGQQQLRISNILNELEMPARLFMPTASVTAQFEHLVNSVVQLVDLRKVSDKLDGEIKIEEQKKAERDRARGIVPGQTDGATKGAADADKKAENKTEEGAGADKKDGKDTKEGEADKNAEEADKPDAKVADEAAATSEQKGDNESDKKTTVTRTKDELVPTKEEDGSGDVHEARTTRSGSRPGSSSNNASSAHKRSASVLSVASDKSSKRQKK